METIFLVSIVGAGVHNGCSICGFIDCNDKKFISNYVKNKYNLKLGDTYPPKFTFEIGSHWEYCTDRIDVDVHVDTVYNLKA